MPQATIANSSIDKHVDFIQEIIQAGGPESSEYKEFTDWLESFNMAFQAGTLTYKDLVSIRQLMGDALSVSTLQGFCFQRPHGYAGDFEIIDKIYKGYATIDPKLRKWDLFFQSQAAPEAVRNRKIYALDLLNALNRLVPGGTVMPVLNVASGPAKDLCDFFSQKGDQYLTVDCIELDSNAIAYAKKINKDFMDRIKFFHMNAFDFKAEKKYRLIWCAGMFDYLADKHFATLLKRFYSNLEDDGELVVGNFSTENPTRPYMEVIGNWMLNHRTEEQLVSLAKTCGVESKDLYVGREPLGVNLFLHIKKGPDFINM